MLGLCTCFKSGAKLAAASIVQQPLRLHLLAIQHRLVVDERPLARALGGQFAHVHLKVQLAQPRFTLDALETAGTVQSLAALCNRSHDHIRDQQSSLVGRDRLQKPRSVEIGRAHV